jgi:hypothetical protein
MDRRTRKSFTLRRVEDSLKGMGNHYTVGSDVGNEPFPFTEENNISKEQFHYEAPQNKQPL